MKSCDSCVSYVSKCPRQYRQYGAHLGPAGCGLCPGLKKVNPTTTMRPPGHSCHSCHSCAPWCNMGCCAFLHNSWLTAEVCITFIIRWLSQDTALLVYNQGYQGIQGLLELLQQIKSCHCWSCCNASKLDATGSGVDARWAWKPAGVSPRMGLDIVG